jgi:hypothetical protein
MNLPGLSAHPFAVDAFFERSCTLTFALPAEVVAERLPPGLEPDVFDDRWGFLAVAVVRTRRLRPSGFPAFLGRDFVLVGYRFFARYRAVDGRRLRGLVILRSETDRRSMVFLGNIFTRYRYQHNPMRLEESDGRLSVSAAATGLRIEVDTGDAGESPLPGGSPFASWDQARRYCGPMPFTFSHDARSGEMILVEGVRSGWKPRPVGVTDFHIPFFAEVGLPAPVLASAFMVENIPYHWRAGRREPLPVPVS